MTARKKAASRKTARKKTERKKTTKKKAPRKEARRKKRAAPRRTPAAKQPASASLADRAVELVEQAAAAALRRVVDVGGRELAGWLPESSEMRHEAGAYLREVREVAGLTIDEVADAIELRDHSILEAVEAGTTTLSFELLLRLAAILARHDPIPFLSRMIRAQNPVLWQLLEDWGFDRLPLQLEREQAFVNILRGHDRARDLPDEDFDRILGFTRAAFEMALDFTVTEK